MKNYKELLEKLLENYKNKIAEYKTILQNKKQNIFRVFDDLETFSEQKIQYEIANDNINTFKFFVDRITKLLKSENEFIKDNVNSFIEDLIGDEEIFLKEIRDYKNEEINYDSESNLFIKKLDDYFYNYYRKILLQNNYIQDAVLIAELKEIIKEE